MHQLICPCDVHVYRVAIELGLLSKATSDWQSALLLTQKLKQMDSCDPVKYDFALFGISAFAKKPMLSQYHSVSLQPIS